MTPGDSVAGTVSVSVTGVVAVVVSSSEELMKEVVLEAEGLVVTGVCASCSPSVPSPSPSGSLLTPEGHEETDDAEEVIVNQERNSPSTNKQT